MSAGVADKPVKIAQPKVKAVGGHHTPRVAHIESLDHEGRGIAHVDGKAIFIDGAVTYETVEFSSYRKKDNFEQALVTRIVKSAAGRTTPHCEHFGVCGGCAMQHIEPRTQLAAKQRVLEDNLARIGHVQPELMLPAIDGPTWGYRMRARLGVHYVEKKGGVLVGFHERKSSYVADMHNCHVLPPSVARLIDPLRDMFTGFACRDRIPQVEVAVGDHVIILVLRHLEPVPESDLAKLRAFADAYGVAWWLQPKGPDTAHPYYPQTAPALTYSLPEFQLVMGFRPTEFTQVNTAVNRSLVGRAVRALAPQPGERVGDLFCGLGNFTLAIARSGAQTVGVEGSDALVARAHQNAAANGLVANTEFFSADLYTDGASAVARLGTVDKLLIDPPRDGAMDVCKALPDQGIRRLVYVSCNPSTLARDANVLVHVKGFRLKAAGVVNMFPHTAHVESMAVFER
jgi:23S rRNA (uracil1939-C5)-methyltransferase